MKLPKLNFGEALDAWSDFAIDCWLYAIRFALGLLALFFFYGITGRWAIIAWDRVIDYAFPTVIALFGLGVLFAILVRIERFFAKEKQERKPQLSGGRTAKTRRPKRRQWGNRKRKRTS